MKELKELIAKEEGPTPAANLAVKLGISENYVRAIANGKQKPGWRLLEAIEDLYNKEEQNA